jgi:dipeptidyl aminopeptidase/acylaminoacyl peptidase
MDMPEKEKPKRKRKRSAWHRWQLLLLSVVLLLSIGGGVVYWQNSQTIAAPPVPTEYFSPVPTPMLLPDQCDLTDDTYRIRADGQLAQERWIDSPDKHYRMRYNPQGIALHDIATNTLIEQLVPELNTSVLGNWSPDSRYFAYLDDTTLAVYDTQTLQQTYMTDEVIQLDKWSPDSRWFTFSLNQQIWLASADGSEIRALTPPSVGSSYYYVSGWSPTGAHVEIIYSTDTRREMTIIPTDKNQPIVIRDELIPSGNLFFWSPDGSSILYMPYTSPTSPTNRLVITRLDGSATRTYKFPLNHNFYGGESVQWSPNSQYVVVYFLTNRSSAELKVQMFDFIHENPITLTEQGENMFYTLLFDSSAPTIWRQVYDFPWSDDSHMFRYWEKQSNNDHALREFDLTTDLTRTVFEGSLERMVYSRASDAILIYNRTGFRFSLTRLNKDMTVTPLVQVPVANPGDLVWSSDERVSVALPGIRDNHSTLDVVNTLNAKYTSLLPKNTVDAGAPNWSPNGTYVAVTYATLPVSDPERRVTLRWLNATTGEIYALDNDFLSVYDLVWSADERYLAYTAWRAETGTTLEVIDTVTGEQRQLWANAENVREFDWNTSLNTFTVWVPTPDPNEWQYTAITSQGNLLWQVTLTGNPAYGHVFWSADGESAFVKGAIKQRFTGSGTPYNRWLERLEWFDKNGQHQVITQRLLGLGDPNFAPDGKHLIVTEWRDDRTLFLTMLDTSGDTVWQTPLPALGIFVWEMCPPPDTTSP